MTGEKCIVRNFVINSLRQMLLGRRIVCEEDGLGMNPARDCEEFVPLNFRTSCVENTTGTWGLSGMIQLKWVLNVCTVSLIVTCVTEHPGRCRLSMPQSCCVQGQDKRNSLCDEAVGNGYRCRLLSAL
jgi:hypothetical protein